RVCKQTVHPAQPRPNPTKVGSTPIVWGRSDRRVLAKNARPAAAWLGSSALTTNGVSLTKTVLEERELNANRRRPVSTHPLRRPHHRRAAGDRIVAGGSRATANRLEARLRGRQRWYHATRRLLRDGVRGQHRPCPAPRRCAQRRGVRQ